MPCPRDLRGIGIADIITEEEINNLTLEQYLTLIRGNQAPGVVKPEFEGNVNFKIKSQFMRELREDTFSGNKNDDALEHVERVLDIVSLFNILGVTHDVVMLRAFPITLTEALKDSNNNSEGTVAIISKLDSLGRDIKKLKENVHAIQVGCQTFGGAHLNKECPLNEEVKSMEKVKYGEFGSSSPFNNGAKYHVCPPGYYTRIDNRPPFGEKRPSLEKLLNKHLEESTRRSAEMEEWVKKL
ncbi:hypothetical protein Tco_1337010 [Tanacetum coccineum]